MNGKKVLSFNDIGALTDVVDTSVPVRSVQETVQEKAEKRAKLQQALEPKSLEDIRRERAIKRASGKYFDGFVNVCFIYTVI